MFQDQDIVPEGDHTGPVDEGPLSEPSPEKPPLPLAPKQPVKPAPPPRTPKAQPPDWTPIDVSKGIFRNKELHTYRASFERHLRDDTKAILSKPAQRRELAKRLAPKRGQGITKTEMKDVIKSMEKDKLISSKKGQQLRRKFGVSKSSFF